MKAQSAMALFTLMLMSYGSAYAKHPKPPKPSEFENAEIRVEQNATDGDTEVVIFAKGGDDGFRHFRVTSPDRRIVVATYSLDRTVRGQRELLFESPEPPGEAILRLSRRQVPVQWSDSRRRAVCRHSFLVA